MTDSLTSPQNGIVGSFTESDREVLDQYFRLIAWTLSRHNKVQLGSGWNIETTLADGRKVKYKFKVEGCVHE